MTPDIAAFLAELLGRQSLSCADPTLVATAQMVARAQAELAEILAPTPTDLDG